MKHGSTLASLAFMLCFSLNASRLYTAFLFCQKPFGSHCRFLWLVIRIVYFPTILGCLVFPFSLSHFRHLHPICSFANIVCLFVQNLCSELHSIGAYHYIVVWKNQVLRGGTRCVCSSLTLAQIEMCLLQTYLLQGCRAIAMPCACRLRLFLAHSRAAWAVMQLC
mgnify:CR=1 FL=1